jgi:hypothetical protein
MRRTREEQSDEPGCRPRGRLLHLDQEFPFPLISRAPLAPLRGQSAEYRREWFVSVQLPVALSSLYPWQFSTCSWPALHRAKVRDMRARAYGWPLRR